MKTLNLIIIICLLTVIGCKKDDNDTQSSDNLFINGVFIVNEGAFPSGTGTISFYNKSTHAIKNDIFQEVNSVPLGSVAQSLSQFFGKAYIVVNNSNKIEVVNSVDFKSMGTINGLVNPRYFAATSNLKGYVSGWDNKVSIINLSTLQISGYIPTGTGPEKMLQYGDYLLVLNQGGYDIDSTITVINTTTDAVVKTIQVYPKPTGIVVQDNGTIWVMCSGKGWNNFPQLDDSRGHLIALNGSSLEIEQDYIFPVVENHPDKLVIDKTTNTLYFLYPGGICKYETGTGTINTNPYIGHTGLLYGLGFDKKEKMLYTSDALDYNQDGWV